MTLPNTPEALIVRDGILQKSEITRLKNFVKDNPKEIKDKVAGILEDAMKIKEIMKKNPTSLSREETAVAQFYINLLGNPIKIDGLYGPETTNAIKRLNDPNVKKNETPHTTDKKETKIQSEELKERINAINVSNIIKDPVDMSIAYLSHQQGAGGATSILKGMLYGTEVSDTIWSHMKGNVGKDFKDLTGVDKSKLNPQTFFTYWYKKLHANIQKVGQAKTQHDEVFEKVSQQTGMPLPLLKAIVYTESGFDANANKYGKSQFKGLMQLGKDAREAFGVTNPYDPYQNMIGGVKTIKSNMNPTLRSLSNTIKQQGVANVLTKPISSNQA